MKREAKCRSAGTIEFEKVSVTNCRDKVSCVRGEWGSSQDDEATLAGANSCVEMQQQDLAGSGASNPAAGLSDNFDPVGATAAANAALDASYGELLRDRFWHSASPPS